MRGILLIIVLMAVCATCGYFAGGVIEQWAGLTRELADNAASRKPGAGSAEINFEPGAGSLLGLFVGLAVGFLLGFRWTWRRARGGRAEWFTGD